jgi:hypothetical protein
MQEVCGKRCYQSVFGQNHMQTGINKQIKGRRITYSCEGWRLDLFNDDVAYITYRYGKTERIVGYKKVQKLIADKIGNSL